MVLAERGSGAGVSDVVRNGKRSRGSSPTTHGSNDSSSDEENVVPFPAEKIRVGRDYQAVCPELEPPEDRKPDLIADRALLVWSPTFDISDNKLDEYITIAKEKYGYNGEQALGMLFWHKHDLNRASLDLANFTPFPDEWTVEDKVLFDQAFQFHGKSFHRIRQMLPDKSIASLVKYYYGWKKTRARTSMMDRAGTGGTPGSTGKRDSDGPSDNAPSDHADSDNDEKGDGRGREGAKWCTVCGISCTTTTQHNSHKLCQACLVHARRTGNMRPLCGPAGRRGPKQQRFKHRLPRGIYINHDDLVAMATGPQPGDPSQPGLINQGEAILKAMEREIVSLKRQVQTNKQQLSAVKRKLSDGGGAAGVDEARVTPEPHKINPRWTSEELLMAVTGVRKYGKDFSAIAETIGTKTESHVRTFFASYRRRYNLDAVLREHEAESGKAQPGGMNTENSETTADNGADTNGASNSPAPKDEKMEVDSEGCALGAPAEQGGAPTTPAKPRHK